MMVDGGGWLRLYVMMDSTFYLCSNRVTLEHPFYNTFKGKSEWKAKRQDVFGINKRDNGDNSV
jgi:hypothetical protein